MKYSNKPVFKLSMALVTGLILTACGSVEKSEDDLGKISVQPSVETAALPQKIETEKKQMLNSQAIVMSRENTQPRAKSKRAHLYQGSGTAWFYRFSNGPS